MRLECSLLTAGAAALLAFGCSVLYPLQSSQCDSDGDCARLAQQDSSLKGTACVASVCVGVQGAGGAGNGDGAPCSTHAQCMARIAGEEAICREGKCIDLKGGRCPIILDEGNLLRSEVHRDPIVLGAFATVEDPERLQVETYRLALREFAQSEGTRWPFLFVVCDRRTEVSKSVSFLTNTLKSPTLIVPLQTRTLIDVAETLFAGDNHTPLLLSPWAADSSLAAVDDRERLWFMLPSSKELVPAGVEVAERYIKGSPAARVAVLHATNYVEMSDMAKPITDALRPQVARIDQILVNDDDATSNAAAQRQSYGEALIQLTKLKPTLIIAFTDTSFLDEILSNIESNWPIDERPQYLLSFYQTTPSKLDQAIAAHPGLASRLVGVNYAAAAPDDRIVLQRYWEAFAATRKQTVEELIAANAHTKENYYDAAWFALYANVAAGANQRPVTDGALVADGMKRVVTGTDVVDVGPGDVSETVAALGDAATRIKLRGALGTLDFDLDTRGPRGTGSVFCATDEAPETVATDVARFDQDAKSYPASELEKCVAF